MGDEEPEWMALPAEEKVQHNVWKVRIAGYEEVTKLFESLEDETSQEFSKYAGLLRKFAADVNAIAQQKGLEAIKAFVKNSAISSETTQEVVDSIITECLSTRRQMTRDLGKEVIMSCVEAGQHDVVEGKLIYGLRNKNPTAVIGCIECLKEGLRDFGSNVIQVKQVLKVLSTLMKHTTGEVREETKELIIEIYRWTGPDIKSHLTDLKPSQMEELNAEFEKIGTEKPVPVRFLRSQRKDKANLYKRSSAMKDDQIEFKISPADAYADEAKLVVDSVIEMAIKRLETSLSKSDKEITFESRRRSEMSRDSTIARDENYTLEDISWVSVGDFSVRRAERTLKEFIQTWSYDKSWHYCIDYLGADEHEFDVRHRYRVEWSIPTRRKPIPRATARVYFTFQVSKVKPKNHPVEVYYVFETQRLVHRPGDSRFREKWLKDIIESKVSLIQAVEI